MRDTRIHREFDRYATVEFQGGELPAWMHVRREVAGYVFQGPYTDLGSPWGTFPKKFLASKPGEAASPPGEVYVCDPEDHKGARESKMLTILRIPLKA